MLRRPAPATPVDTRAAALRESRTRILIVKIGLLAFFAVVVVRLVEIQVIRASTYRDKAQRQYDAPVDLPPQRGKIFDRHGRMLVSNSTFISFGADPKLTGNQDQQIADRFARVFDKPRGEYLRKLSDENKRFVWLERRVNPEYAKNINPREFKGLVVIEEPRRLHHYDRVAGHVLGFTDIDNKGLAGLEWQLDSLLSGRKGYVVMQRDGENNRRPSVDKPRVEPQNGNSVVLTIDIQYQTIAEEELRKGMEWNSAESGIAVILDPKTGEVLAMASYPSINLVDRASMEGGAERNRVITDMFEPGSTFKLVTAAAALENNLVRPEQKFDAEHGLYIPRLPNGKKRTPITDTHKYGLISFQEAVEVSSNIVMAKVSDVIGDETLFRMARRFGFGSATGIDLPGETRGELKIPKQWSGTTRNAIAYGYEVAVTPLQIAAAYAAVANDGKLMKPFVVKQVVDAEGVITRQNTPELVRQVISKKTAHTLTGFLQGVVERGTGTLAKLNSVSVAGKTGTARKYVDGHYVPGSYIASFAGFFPAEDPAAVCLVMLDIPGSPTYTGGLVSAPIFRAIAEKIYAISDRFAQKPAMAAGSTPLLVVPDVTTLKVDAATVLLVAQGFDVEAQGEGAMVVRQMPSAGMKVPKGTRVVLASGSTVTPAKGYAIVPDVRGLPIRRAVNRLSLQRLDVAVIGSGLVTSQVPLPGEQVKRGTRIVVRCESKNLSLMTLY